MSSSFKILHDAVVYYTGAGFHPSSKNPSWVELADWLEAQRYSAYEYCAYMVAHHVKKAAVLRMPSAMAYKKNREAFVAFKLRRIKAMDVIMEMQRDLLMSYLEYGKPLAVVLMDDMVDLNPITRIEEALYEASVLNFDPTAVIAKYLDKANELAAGNPEYLLFTPFIRELGEESDREHPAGKKFRGY